MEDLVTKETGFQVSEMAATLIGSEIIKLAGEIREKIKTGEKILNYTIGDFDPKIFPIPDELKQEIIESYNQKETNYPPAEGIPELRKAVSNFLKSRLNLEYPVKDILIACGARPLIYGFYRTVINPGDTVIFPLPSWNNNHYCHLVGAKPCSVETFRDQNFMPTAEDLKPHIKKASMVSLCSPLNPTGTVFEEDSLRKICELILEENNRRKGKSKPLYLLYDQIYWLLTYGKTNHFDPVNLLPEMKDYTFYVDGISKAFAATGVRVGWAFGPDRIIDKMKSILSHVGAWAPKAEQVATANFLAQDQKVDSFLIGFRKQIQTRLEKFYADFMQLKSDGYKVDAIAPHASIYLTVRFNLHGAKTKDGTILHSTSDVTKYILNEAKIAIVPFYAFGADNDSTWYRLSVGTTHMSDIEPCFSNLRKALSMLSL